MGKNNQALTAQGYFGSKFLQKFAIFAKICARSGIFGEPAEVLSRRPKNGPKMAHFWPFLKNFSKNFSNFFVWSVVPRPVLGSKIFDQKFLILNRPRVTGTKFQKFWSKIFEIFENSKFSKIWPRNYPGEALG